MGQNTRLASKVNVHLQSHQLFPDTPNQYQSHRKMNPPSLSPSHRRKLSSYPLSRPIPRTELSPTILLLRAVLWFLLFGLPLRKPFGERLSTISCEILARRFRGAYLCLTCRRLEGIDRSTVLRHRTEPKSSVETIEICRCWILTNPYQTLESDSAWSIRVESNSSTHSSRRMQSLSLHLLRRLLYCFLQSKKVLLRKKSSSRSLLLIQYRERSRPC